MAKEIDLETPFEVEDPETLPGHIPSDADPNSHPDTVPRPNFHPIRRKLDIKFIGTP